MRLVGIGLQDGDPQPQHRHLAPSHVVDEGLETHLVIAIATAEQRIGRTLLRDAIGLEQIQTEVEELRALRLQTPAVALVEHHQYGDAHQRDRIAQHSLLSSRLASATAW